jgi:hypothetical protein
MGKSKEKHGVWDPLPLLTKTSPYVDSRVGYNIFNMDNPLPESTLTLCQSRLYPPVRDLGFGLCERIFAKDDPYAASRILHL